MVLFRNGTDKNRFRTHFFLSFPTCKRSPSFWNRSASFLPEPVFLRVGLKRMRTSLSSFISLALSVPVSKKKQRVNGLNPIPRFSEDRAIFYPFRYKTCAYKRSNFVGTGTHFYPRRSASFDV